MKIKTKKEVADYISEQMKEQSLTQAQLKEKMYMLMPDNLEDYYTNETKEQKSKRDKQKLADNISKWLKGDRYPGTEYLFYLSQALKVTIENILTTGECNEKYDDRVTLYSMAKCTDLSLIDKFMNQNGEVFINYDEFDKTLIDYIIEFKNINLIKFFIDKGIISFSINNTIISPFRIMLYPNNERYYSLLEIIIENDELDYFKIFINRSAIINRDNTYNYFPINISDELLLKTLNSKKIFNYLCDTYIPNDNEWNYYNLGIIPRDSRVRDFAVVSGWFNELLRVALDNGFNDIANKMIDFGIEYNNNVAEIISDKNYLIDSSFAIKSRNFTCDCLILLVGCKINNVPKEFLEKIKKLELTIDKCGKRI